MYFDVSFTIPANTAKATPEELKVKLTHGVIHRVEVGFPSGCAGLAHLQIKRGGYQVWPTNPEGSFNSDGYTIPINEHYELFEEPYSITLVGWNLDDTYQHTLEVRIGILPESVFKQESPLTEGLRKLLRAFRL